MNYIDKADLLQHFKEAQANGVLTDELAWDFMLITNKVAQHKRFNRYTFLDDMKGDALCVLCRKWVDYDTEANTSPLSWVTSVVWFTFLNSILKEKKHWLEVGDDECDL